jgi:hypothetical protein
LKAVGKAPSERDKFINLVIGITSTSMHDFSRVVGIGSRSQDLVGAVVISRFTSASEMGEKTFNSGRFGCPGGLSVGMCEPVEGKEAWMRGIVGCPSGLSFGM